MTKILKNFQQKAVDNILTYVNGILGGNAIKTIILQSPTGSGKTFMMSQVINRLATDPNFDSVDMCFLWVSIGKGALHEQSYNSLKQIFNGYPECHLIENEFTGGRDKINRNEVVVLNWEKLRAKDNTTGDWKNILMKDKETYNFIDVIQNTKEEGRKIVLIIDESHSSTDTARAKELRDEIICPDITIEMSATPTLSDMAFPYKVDPNDVINEGLIKKEIIINENIDKISDNDLDSEKLVLEAAYQKQKELKQAYSEEGININPLVLIQLPNSADGDNKKDAIENFLQTKGISQDKGNLAVWLSEEKVNTETPYLRPNTSKVDFLIFKQAIDTGWDCPRASILVRFREVKSPAFEIQTVGRILRMPEAHHYDNEILNKGYIFTNIKSLEIKKETYNPNIIKSLYTKRKDINDFKLKSYYKNRISYNDLTSSFYPVFEEIFCKYFGFEKGKFEFFGKNRTSVQGKLLLDNLTNNDEIILNKTIEANIVDHVSKITDTNKTSVILSENDKEAYIKSILSSELNGFAAVRSLPIMQMALLRCISQYFGINQESDKNWIVTIESIILNNPEVIKQLLNLAVASYKPIKIQEDEQKENDADYWNDNWTIPVTKNYNPNTYEKIDSTLSIYQPCYLEIDRSNPEKVFVEFLEKHPEKIAWWWKNGDEHMQENFGIAKPDGSSFQPDFIVQYQDGRIGIYDTKSSGFQEEDTKIKAETLQQYLSTENSKGKNLCGGIVIVDGNNLKINSKSEYRTFKNNPEDWDFFE